MNKTYYELCPIGGKPENAGWYTMFDAEGHPFNNYYTGKGWARVDTIDGFRTGVAYLAPLPANTLAVSEERLRKVIAEAIHTGMAIGEQTINDYSNKRADEQSAKALEFAIKQLKQ